MQKQLHRRAVPQACGTPFKASPVPPRIIAVNAACKPAHLRHLSSSRQQQHLRQRQQPVYFVVRSSPSDTAATQPAIEEEDFDLLSTRIAELQKLVAEELKGCSIYLIGMMGSGKSTVGKMLGNTLRYAFFDTDAVIEMAHDKKPVSEIFKEYGQDYFRQCESQVIKELAPYRNLVVATGGGAVIKTENWGYMQQGIVCWLKGDVDLLARRVAKDGVEKRPLLYTEGVAPEQVYNETVQKLSKILEERSKYYENADIVVSLSGTGADAETGAPTPVVMYRLLKQLAERIAADKAAREARRNFTIEQTGDVPDTMRTIQSPTGGAGPAPGPQ